MMVDSIVTVERRGGRDREGNNDGMIWRRRGGDQLQEKWK